MKKINSMLNVTDAIQDAMLSKEVSKSDLARALGVHPSSVTRFLNRSTDMTFKNVLRACNHLEIELLINLNQTK